MSQTEKIKNALMEGEVLTPLDALERFGCFRLGARIWELRQAGLPVENVGKKFAAYKLPANWRNGQRELFV